MAETAAPSGDTEELREVVSVLEAAYYNTFQGFQCGGVKPVGSLVLAFLRAPESFGSGGASSSELHEAIAARWRKALHIEGDDTVLGINEWLGCEYIKISWRLYQRIPEILQYALDQGYGLTLQLRHQPYYKPSSKFVPEALEAEYIAHLRELHRECTECGTERCRMAPFIRCSSPAVLSRFNWHTPYGKTFCEELRRCNPMAQSVEDERECNVYSWPCFDAVARKHRLFQYADWWFAPRSLKSAEQQEPLLSPPPMCVICEERAADTLVLPCQHQCVCTSCSVKLKSTPDVLTCVQCRRNITSVLLDEVPDSKPSTQ